MWSALASGDTVTLLEYDLLIIQFDSWETILVEIMDEAAGFKIGARWDESSAFKAVPDVLKLLNKRSAFRKTSCLKLH